MDKPERSAPLEDWVRWREYLMDLDVRPVVMDILNAELATADGVIASKNSRQLAPSADGCTSGDTWDTPDGRTHSAADDDLPF